MLLRKGYGFLSGRGNRTSVGEKVVDDGPVPLQENSVVLLFLTTDRHLMVKKFHTEGLLGRTFRGFFIDSSLPRRKLGTVFFVAQENGKDVPDAHFSF